MELNVINEQGQETAKVAASDAVFGREYNEALIHQIVVAYMANARQGTRAQLTRAEVHHSTKKPFKQKGTGRARAGSNRSPVWRGGAILFGPQPRKYDFKVNKKIRKLALRMALSSRLAGDNLLVVKGFDLPEAKTKVFAKIAGNLGLSKALIIAPEESRNLVLSSRNLPGITLTTPDQLSVYEILKHKQLVLLEGAVEPVETRLK